MGGRVKDIEGIRETSYKADLHLTNFNRKYPFSSLCIDKNKGFLRNNVYDCMSSNEKQKGKRNKIFQCRFQENIMINDCMSGNQTERQGGINIYNIVISKMVPKQHY